MNRHYGAPHVRVDRLLTWASRALGPTVVLVALLAFPTTAASQTTVVPYGASGYRYMVVAHGAFPTFQSPAFDDSGFSTGAAPFGSGGSCPLDSTVQTPWPTDTDLLVRRTVSFPAGASGVTIGVAIDNDVLVYWNGVPVGSQVHEGCATQDSLVVSVPDGLVQPGDNVLAVRGIDRGDISFLDLRVSAVVNAPPDCANAAASPAKLWPPNHKLRPVAVTVPDPDGDPVTVTITSVTQDEPLNGAADGNTSPDAAPAADPAQVLLRAERSGRGDGRVYRLAVEASDGVATCTGTALVGVPHDRGRGSVPVDSGLVVPSFGP
jgi:hypothetical protein